MLVAMPTAMPVQPLTSSCGNLRRQHDRLLGGAVVVGAEVDGALLDLLEQLHRQRREPRLGVAVGGRRVAVERAEVAVPVDQRVAQREPLRHAHHRLVDDAVAVRVVLAQHLADDRRALAELGVRIEVQVRVHRVEDAPLHRLQAVAHVGQRARGDDADRVVQVAALRLVRERGGRGLRWPFRPAAVAATTAAALPLATPALTPFVRHDTGRGLGPSRQKVELLLRHTVPQAKGPRLGLQETERRALREKALALQFFPLPAARRALLGGVRVRRRHVDPAVAGQRAHVDVHELAARVETDAHAAACPSSRRTPGSSWASRPRCGCRSPALVVVAGRLRWLR